MTSKLLSYLFVAILMTGFFVSCDEEEDQVEICNNGVDDDGDGQVDCDDGDCALSDNCSDGEAPVKELVSEIGSMTLSADTVYVLSRFVRVKSGSTLKINAGTIIKARTGDGANSSALIITRGATILAEGEADKPIIFTSILDGIQPGETASTLDPISDKGAWGGLIVLGNGVISAKDDKGGTETNVEGVPVADFTKYGGSNNGDNSGTIRYVSIRFTGTQIEPDSEIQGLTLGGVGSGTTIENIEIISSDDDGIEIFGGAVQIKNALVSYQSDDGLDIDQSFAGSITNSMVITYNPTEGNDAFEFDGPEGSQNTDGKFTIDNCTFVNKGVGSRAGTLKSGAQGTIKNSKFVDFNNWITIEGGSATNNYLSEDLKVMDSDFDLTDIMEGITIFEGDSAKTAQVKQLFSEAGNSATASSSKGSTASFDWTWAATLGILD